MRVNGSSFVGGLLFIESTVVSLSSILETTLVTTLPDEFPDARSIINDLRLQYVVAVEGRCRKCSNTECSEIEVTTSDDAKILSKRRSV
eukprot:XP_025013666.1 aspartate--tRNA ligase, chloroplastic/mitochondrial-like [Ricinus communis]